MWLFLFLIEIVIIYGGEIHFKEEVRLKNVKQLTFGGANAEGYFSFDGNWLTFQAMGADYGTGCDQIYRIDLTLPPNEQIPHRLSTGLGVCTCSYYYPDNKHLIYAGTFQASKFSSNVTLESCPLKVCRSPAAQTDPELKKLCKTYIWDMFPDYDIFKINEYGEIVKQLTNSKGYDAEGAVSVDGKHIVFTSLRSGDPEIWVMDSDGNNAKQLTNELGYDGGPFFSTDGSKICFRASRPKTAIEIATYKTLLSYNLVAPSAMELYTINTDGTNLRKITSLGGSNWAPFYLHDDHRMIFSSNFNASGLGAFDLYMIDEDGSNIERVTYNEKGFDSFPMFDRAGRRLVWGSSRNSSSQGELNLFIADWVEMSDQKQNDEQNNMDEEDNRTKKTAKVQEKVENAAASLPNEEKHMKNIQQMTFSGLNARAFFSYDDRSLTFHARNLTPYGTNCRQVYAMDVMKPHAISRRISTGIGASTYSYFFPNGDSLYASDLLSANWTAPGTCARRACYTATDKIVKKYCKTYLLDLYPDFEIFRVNKFGNFIQLLTDSPGYDSEASVSPDGNRIVFTSTRSGDPEIWSMNSNGTDLKQLTHNVGYDGGPIFSHDGKKIVFRASRPKTNESVELYKKLLSSNLVDPTIMEIFVMNADGSNQKMVTSLGKANWSPAYLKGDQRILFSSNYNSTNPGALNLFAVNEDGSNVEQITFTEGEFHGFCATSQSGDKVTWTVSEYGPDMKMNIYTADWDNSNGAASLSPTAFLKWFPFWKFVEIFETTWRVMKRFTY